MIDDQRGRHRKAGAELPSFTGDVPEDVLLTGRLYRRLVLTSLAKRTVSTASCFFGALLAALPVVYVSRRLPDGVRDHPAALAGYAALAAAATVAALLPRLPGVLRLVCGALAYAFAFTRWWWCRAAGTA